MLNVRSEKKIIPTYEVGKPDKNPLFLNKRVYQASNGKIYPYPIIDKIYDEKIDKEYDVIIVENDYIEIMIMPSLGGRIQYGYDKLNDYYFFYNNEVIKPALVGLCGPWLSGGVEFNWPQHHRPSTFSPVETGIENGENFVIVWQSEMEKLSGLIGVAGIKIYENSNRVEVLGKSINNTNLPKTFLWWANVAVHCHDEYESFFPRDVKFVADHGKREVTSYPYANSQYYNMDYPNYDLDERNITNFKNIKVPMSYMAVGSKYNFFGGYDFKKGMGTLHISNTHTAPGKKQWTWGDGEFGKAWDRHLTDENGPYIELMAGVYTDNQPDFTWINAGETKEFKQTWYPFSNIGKALNANEELAYNIVDDKLAVFSTIDQMIDIKVTYKDDIRESFSSLIKVGETLFVDLQVDLEIVEIVINDLSYIEEERKEDFSPAIEPDIAENVQSIDELFNIGLHLEQYRHATRDAKDYYHQILKLDKCDARANTRLGYMELEAGRLNEAKQFFDVAVKAIIKYNPNPFDCGSIFGLASTYKYLGEVDLAYKYFHKAIWDFKYKAKGYLELAKLDYKVGNTKVALENINESLKYDNVNLQALTLRIRIIEKLGEEVNYHSLVLDKPYNYYARYFNNSLEFLQYINNDDKTILEIVELLTDLGEIKKAKRLIESSKSTNPILKMYRIINNDELDNNLAIDGCFPYTVFERIILEKYLAENNDLQAKFLLTLLLIDKEEKELAYRMLKEIYNEGYKNSIFLRVLGLCEFNVGKNEHKAQDYYLEAIKFDPTDSRLVYEYDQLRKILNVIPQNRMEFLNANIQMVEYRDDLKLEYASLLCQLGKYQECIKYMESVQFHPFEGGEGKVIEVYKTAKLALVQIYIDENKYDLALELLVDINIIPKCLGEGIIFGSPNADVLYFLGICYEALGNKKQSEQAFKECVEEKIITSSKLSYKPEKLQMNYYQALAYEKLGDKSRKNEIIEKLENLAEEKLRIKTQVDFFAISVPEFSIFDQDLNLISKAHCYYLLALCAKAKGNIINLEKYKEQALRLNINKLEMSLL